MTCNDVELLIRRGGQGTDILYKLVIEQNNMFLFTAGSLVAQALTPNILSCLEYKAFLLKWHNDVIDVIQSGNGGRILLSYVFSEDDYTTDSIHGLSIGAKVYSEWIIPRLGSMFG